MAHADSERKKRNIISTTSILEHGFRNRLMTSTRRVKNLLYVVAAIHSAAFLLGYVLVYFQVPFAVGIAEMIRRAVSVSPVLTPVTSFLKEGNLALAITYTFVFNLSYAAFLWTTLIGIMPLIGALGIMALTAFRNFTDGAVYYYVLHVSNVSVGYSIVAIGTAILEDGAYVFSATAGVNISLSTLFPRRYSVKSRGIAFKMAWKDAANLYVIVVILLALGAIWEIGGIYLTRIR